MQKFQDVILDQYGNVVQGASVIVYKTGTTVKPTIYSDNGITIAANPLTTDSLGRYYFYAVAGRYDLAISGSKIVSYTETDVVLQDSKADLSASSGSSLVGFLQSGTGAVATTLQTEGRRFAFPDQFGAVGDGITDDGLAIRRAITSLATGGKLLLRNGATYATTLGCGIQGVIVEGGKATIKAVGAGAGAFLLDANLARDHTTVVTDGQGATVRDLKVDGNSQNWSGVRTSGGRSDADNVEVLNCVSGFIAYLPIAATFRKVYCHNNTGVGFQTTAGAGANGTSSSFQGVWAFANGSHGILITQLSYSSLIDCVGQANTGDDIRIDGSVGGITSMYSIGLYNCGSEGALAKPFNLINQREFVIATPRIISPPANQDFITCNNSSGVVISYSPVASPGAGFNSLSVVADATGIQRPVKLVGGGSSGTLVLNDETKFALIDTWINGRSRTLVSSVEVSEIIQADDFTGAALSALWTSQKGTDPACALPIILGSRGFSRMVTGAGAGATMAVNGVRIASGVNWQPSIGGMSCEIRLTMSANTNIAVFAGLADQNSSLIMPFTLAAGDVLSANAADSCGVFFDTNATTLNWWLVGVAANVLATKQNTALAPAGGVFETFRFELSTAGVMTVYRNGVAMGSAMAGAVTSGIGLTPVVAAFSRAAASRNIDVDYIRCTQTR